MTIWYVRPDTSHSATRNGTSYATAWGGWSEIVWGTLGVNAGDTLYLCGTHAYTTSRAIGAHGSTSDANRTTIRGDYTADPGIINFSSTGFFDAGRNYTTLKSVTISSTSTGYNGIYLSAKTGFVVDGCAFSGADNGITLASNVAFTSCSILNSTFSGHTNAGINQSIATASINSSGIIVSGNTVHDTGFYGIQLSIATAALDTSRLTNYTVSNNTVYNTPGSSIYLRSCKNDTTTVPGIYSAGLVISGNTVHDCGTIAGASGKHGGLLVMGFDTPTITRNTVRDCYVTGAGIQTAKNTNPLISYNTVSGIRSGTPASEYQGGFPIDGNGIFFDNLTIGGLATGNHISDLISTGDPNSGCGLAIWTATGASYIGNVVENCNRGVFYGRAEETGNVVQNNTFINCNVGIWKVGTNALAGNITVKNNIFHNCGTGLSAGANPCITADYNCVHATTPYSGITAGPNDIRINPHVDGLYRPISKFTGATLGGADFYGNTFSTPQPIGAVNASAAPELSALQQTELQKAVTRTVYFVELQFQSSTQYICSANQTITWGGRDWIGLGTVSAISAVEESEGVESKAMTFTLNVAQASYLSLAVGDVEEYRGRPAKMYFCPLDESFQLVGTPQQCWRGIMDLMSIGIEGEEGRITLKAETSAYGLKRQPALRLNAAQQKKKYPTDTGFDYLTDIIANPVVWLSAKFQRSIN